MSEKLKRGRKKKINLCYDDARYLLELHGTQANIARYLEVSQAIICKQFKELGIYKWNYKKTLQKDIVTTGYDYAVKVGAMLKDISISDNKIANIKAFEAQYKLDFFELIAGIKTIENSQLKYKLKNEVITNA
jgi:hypothetical protein